MSELETKDDLFNLRVAAIDKGLDTLAMENLKVAVKSGHYKGPELLAMKAFDKLIGAP